MVFGSGACVMETGMSSVIYGGIGVCYVPALISFSLLVRHFLYTALNLGSQIFITTPMETVPSAKMFEFSWALCTRYDWLWRGKWPFFDFGCITSGLIWFYRGHFIFEAAHPTQKRNSQSAHVASCCCSSVFDSQESSKSGWKVESFTNIMGLHKTLCLLPRSEFGSKNNTRH